MTKVSDVIVDIAEWNEAYRQAALYQRIKPLLDEMIMARGKATSGRIDTSQYIEKNGCYECPLCDSSGVVDADTFTNFDDAALGVQFFGIGPQHEQWQKAWKVAANNTAAIAEILKGEDDGKVTS